METNSPSYPPQFESPLEEDFAYHFAKYIEPTISLVPQFEVKTICGTFRIDFVAQGPAGIIGFECDGKDFHDESRDEWRDAMILGSKGIDSIYRLRGSDLYYHIDDILHIISRWNPELFSQRGLLNLETLASDAVRESEEYSKSVAFIRYHDEDSPVPFEMIVRRRFPEAGGSRRQFWEAAYTFALSVGGGKLDDVIKQYRAQKIGDGSDWSFS